MAGALFAGPAQAASYSSTVTPDPFSYPDTQDVTYRLLITTGAEGENLRVTAYPPAFEPKGWAAFMAFDDDLALEGPGTVVSRTVVSGHGDRFCNPVLPDVHGTGPSFQAPVIEVQIPPNSNSAIAAVAHPLTGLGYAPWLGIDTGAEFEVQDTSSSLPQTIHSPSPRNDGKHGVRISLQTDPEGKPGGCPYGPFSSSQAVPVVELGKEIVISGTADGEVAGQRMTLRTPDRTLADVPIADDGSFSYRWRPEKPGDHTIGALYRSQSPDFLDDFSVPVTLRVVEPAKTSRPADPTKPGTDAARDQRRLPALAAHARIACLGRDCRLRLSGSVRAARSARGSSTPLTACSGRVRVRLYAWRKRLLSTRARVRRSCRYTVRKRFRLRAGKRPARLKVTTWFGGDSNLKPRAGRPFGVPLR